MVTEAVRVILYNITGFILLIFVLFITIKSFIFTTSEKKCFILAISFNLCLLSLEVIEYIFYINPNPDLNLLRIIINFFGFALSPVVPYFILMHFKDIAKKTRMLLNIPLFFNMILCFSSCFSGIVFEVNNEGIYSRGILFVVPFLIAIFYVFLAFYKTKNAIVFIDTFDISFVISLILVIILSSIIQIIFSQFFLIWNVSAICLILYIVFIHTQYFKIDDLTNVYNRNVFEKDLKKYNKHNCYLILIDMDNLKTTNDTYGHSNGDSVIKHLTTILKENVDKSNKIYRIGGDEFIIMCCDAEEQNVETIVSKIQKSIDEYNQINDFPLSVSIGYAKNDINNQIDIRDVFNTADKEMYKNKQTKKSNSVSSDIYYHIHK